MKKCLPIIFSALLMVSDKSAVLAKSLSTENMKLSPCEIYLIEINSEAEEAIQ